MLRELQNLPDIIRLQQMLIDEFHCRIDAAATSISPYFDNISVFTLQEHVLRELHNLPDIIRLQQMLIDKFHRRIDAAEATSMSIQDFIDNMPPGKGHYNVWD